MHTIATTTFEKREIAPGYPSEISQARVEKGRPQFLVFGGKIKVHVNIPSV